MNGFPGERSPGPGDTGRSVPSAHPSGTPAGHGMLDASESAPHWQELADAVWLAAYWNSRGHTPGSGEAEVPSPLQESEPGPPPARMPESSFTPPAPAPVPPPMPDADPEGPLTLRLGRPQLPLPRSERPEPARRTALLARSLHRAGRRVPSRTALELDEAATAERALSDDLWLPCFRRAEDTAFDLVLLTDDAPTVRIWDEDLARLTSAAEASGAFRDVRSVKVVLPTDGAPVLRWNTTSGADPAELLDGSGTRIFLVVTDGLAHGWAGRAADALLTRLGRAGPTAIVHLLPPHLRHRSSLYPYPAVLEAGGFGAPNPGLLHRPPTSGPDPVRPLPEGGDDTLPVPVLSLKPQSLAAWADLVTGERGVRHALPVVLAGALTKGSPTPGLNAPPHGLPAAARAIVRRFRTLATPAARRLAAHLATVPLDFGLIDQLRRRAMPETGPAHLAEIFMGGLIDWDGAGQGRPDFAEGVREALLATTTRPQLARIVGLLGELPAAGDGGMALRAAVRDPAGIPLPDPWDDWWRPELAIMRALSGHAYSERANRIELPQNGMNRRDVVPAGPASESSSDTDGDDVEQTDRPSGELVPIPVLPTSDPQAPEAEPPMHSSTTTAGNALLVNVPLRNTSFVGRTALLAQVEEQLEAQDAAAVLPHALQGLGGVGKSQLALEYVYKHQQQYKVICWIPAERESLILGALSQLAARLGVVPADAENRGAPAANTAVPAVLEALSTGVPYDNWLLVFDNAEDIETVRGYFPANGPGKIIVTSRNRDWDRVATPLPVDVFERAESIQLLQKRSPGLSRDEAGRLAEALGDLPLAIEQAGAWLGVTGMLVTEYLALLDQRSPEIHELDPNPDYPVSVAAAWDISLGRIAENNPGARKLLDICACMAPEPVPLSLLRGSRGIDIAPEVNPVLREAIKLSRAIRDLGQFSLVRLDLRNDTLQMHRLLQNVLLTKLGDEERQATRDAAHQLLSAAKPGQPSSSLEWPAYLALLPHILTSEAVASDDTWVRELIYETTSFLYYWGDHENAVVLARQARETWTRTSGETDAQALRMSKLLAFCLRVLGRVAESIPLNEQALEISRRADVEEEELLDSMTQMCDALRYQGAFAQARDLAQEAYDRAISQFGLDDPTTLQAAHALGVGLRLCGQYREALALDQDTYRLRDLLFGPNSGLTFNTLNAVALDMCESGDYPGARDRQEETYRRQREAVGEGNPTAMAAARNLAVFRRRDGAVAEAAKLSEDTLRRLTTRYGGDHSAALTVAINVVVDRRLVGDLEGSRSLGEETVRRNTQRLGPDHAHTLITMANLAATRRALGDVYTAQELDDAAAARLAATLGKHHVLTRTVAIGQANNHYARLDFERAHELDQANLPLLIEAVGQDHPLTLACTANLALDLRGLGRGAEADELGSRAVEGFSRVVRSDHPWLLAAQQRRRIECDLAPMPL
ncbi:FxSxx-COOH system tetratricopeptide repeat protein [Streptomyces chiangmaiensis]|uniref:FxSxx-COOH system tetratricopeptide repeat protein n=1 Tax=Streptomyces chiangmaiensis TaxID=766497 RepID=A0ABU7FSG2_9ACTN|nr:FxSxx-COOH system tetratricopeptide repeat protein [Streptomyces chiangmaiensis]MED7827009.1 FxSxx-COOH system tetratricopeptide repeat protein [Streptomyces chiangmaiensis]